MKIHFIGIGGIGMSSLAQYYFENGHEISGSDLAESEVTDSLAQLSGPTPLSGVARKGIKIIIGNNPENIQKDFDAVVYSPAVKPSNPEFKKAKELGIKLKSYPEALGELTKEYFTIAVSGSHGKSTTTAILGLVLIKAGLDPTVIVGTRLKEFGNSNFRIGKSKYLVIEACEYDGSFLNYSPKIVVVTNVDKEHLDYFKTFANVKKTFKDFIVAQLSGPTPPSGVRLQLVANNDDIHLGRIVKSIKSQQLNVTKYSLRQKEAAKLKKIMQIPGRHNVSNALAVLATARILGVSDETTFKAISEYKGSWRRFEIFERKNYTVVSDYGHHPNEVLATLKAAREKYPKRKIWLIFQPHQYQRTFYLFKDFVKVFRQATASAKDSDSQRKIDQIIITDIYDVAGREEQKINQSVSAEKLVQKIARKNVNYMPIDTAEKFVKENIKSGEVLLIMGAGNIYKLVNRF